MYFIFCYSLDYNSGMLGGTTSVTFIIFFFTHIKTERGSEIQVLYKWIFLRLNNYMAFHG